MLASSAGTLNGVPHERNDPEPDAYLAGENATKEPIVVPRMIDPSLHPAVHFAARIAELRVQMYAAACHSPDDAAPLLAAVTILDCVASALSDVPFTGLRDAAIAELSSVARAAEKNVPGRPMSQASRLQPHVVGLVASLRTKGVDDVTIARHVLRAVEDNLGVRAVRPIDPASLLRRNQDGDDLYRAALRAYGVARPDNSKSAMRRRQEKTAKKRSRTTRTRNE